MALRMGGGVIEQSKAADLVSAAATPIWGADGDTVHITGTTTITSFGHAVQAGSVRWVIFDGILTLTHNGTSLILPGGANIQTAAGDIALVFAETNANARVLAYNVAAVSAGGAGYPDGFANGGAISVDTTDLDAIDVAAGNWRDGGDTDNLVWTAFTDKALDVAWAVGSSAGALDTGAYAASTTYHIWAIKRPDTGVVDMLASLSISAPTMPTSYTLKVRIGSVITDGSTNIQAVTTADTAAWPTGYKFGGTLSFDATDADWINIAAGNWRDEDDLDNMIIPAITDKSLEVVWAVGSVAGMLDTGAIAASTTYSIWAIKRPDTGVVDILASISMTAPTMPTNYTLKRRLGFVLTNGSTNITEFIQTGDTFMLNVPVNSLDADNGGTARVVATLATPVGMETTSICSYRLADLTASAVTFFLAVSIAQTDTAPVDGVCDLELPNTGGTDAAGAFVKEVVTSVTATVGIRQSADTADHTAQVTTLGWVDHKLAEAL